MGPEYGKRTMVDVLEHEAKHHPDRPFACISRSNDLSDGFQYIGFQEIKNATDHVINLLRAEFETLEKHESICYIGVMDLRYNIIFLPSPRNTATVNASLLSQIQCKKLLYSPEVIPVIKKLQGEPAASLQCLQIPDLSTLLAAQPSPVPYDLQFEAIKNEPMMMLHSSGSTGLPKIITMTHGTYAALDNERNFTQIPGRRNHDFTTWDWDTPGCKNYVPFPSFHTGGFVNNVVVPVFTETIPVFGPPLRLPTGSLAAEVLKQVDVKGLFLPPSTLAELYSLPKGAELLKKPSVIVFAGGPLSEDVGNELMKHATLVQFYGSTEAGPIRQLFPKEREDWQYMEFHPDLSMEMQLVDDDDDSCEMVLFNEEETKDFSMLYHNFPGVYEFRTKDLFRPHPSKSGLWKFHARRDDIVVLSNGEKLNPVSMEANLMAVPGVSGALLVGQGRPRIALLVELQAHHNLGDEPIEEIWPFVARLSASMPDYGRVARSMIMVATPDKPFTRAGKGTVVRKLTLAKYENEINALFEDNSSSRGASPLLNPESCSVEDVEDVIQTKVGKVLEGKGLVDVDKEQDLYRQGLDSVKSLEVVDELKRSLVSISGDRCGWLSPTVLYTYPTIKELAEVLLRWIKTGAGPGSEDRISRMRDTLRALETSLPDTSIHLINDSTHEGLTIVIIGSTGFLGQRLLLSFVQDPKIEHIYCLNRSGSALKQWTNFVGEKELDLVSAQQKVSFHQADFTKPAFGISQEIYAEMQNNCNVILHSAWQVNFVLPLPSFSDSLTGLMSSIKLAASSRYSCRLLFISSIAATGVFGMPGVTRKTVPEAIEKNLGASMSTGYGESKMIAEQLLDSACRRSGISTSILRVGQVAPSSNIKEAQWPNMDSVKAMLLTSKELKLVPDDLVEVDWLPVDTVVEIVQRIMHHEAPAENLALSVYNLVNPTPVPWSEFVPSLLKWCGEESKIENLAKWLAAVQRQSVGDFQGLPALQLVSFYELLTSRGELHRYDQGRLLHALKNAPTIEPISEKLFGCWIGQLHTR